MIGGSLPRLKSVKSAGVAGIGEIVGKGHQARHNKGFRIRLSAGTIDVFRLIPPCKWGIDPSRNSVAWLGSRPPTVLRACHEGP
jgi:hypothetical protein